MISRLFNLSRRMADALFVRSTEWEDADMELLRECQRKDLEGYNNKRSLDNDGFQRLEQELFDSFGDNESKRALYLEFKNAMQKKPGRSLIDIFLDIKKQFNTEETKIYNQLLSHFNVVNDDLPDDPDWYLEKKFKSDVSNLKQVTFSVASLPGETAQDRKAALYLLSEALAASGRNRAGVLLDDDGTEITAFIPAWLTPPTAHHVRRELNALQKTLQSSDWKPTRSVHKTYQAELSAAESLQREPLHKVMEFYTTSNVRTGYLRRGVFHTKDELNVHYGPFPRAVRVSGDEAINEVFRNILGVEPPSQAVGR